jgi:protein involved in temperature-dependent protein secretion
MTETATAPQGPWNDANDLVKRLAVTLDSFDWKEADAICADLLARLDNSLVPFPDQPAQKILAKLRKKRQFRNMILMADAFLRCGLTDAQIRRQYAQAMIDMGNFTSAEMQLNALLADTMVSEKEKAEANGLLGRMFKQLYVNAGDPRNPRQQENLRKALNYYYGVYHKNQSSYYWHGINVVALLARAHRDEVRVDIPEDEHEIARQILSELEPREQLTCWDRATAVEANIALNKFPEATTHLVEFVKDPFADAFETTSLYRQLTEVWKIPAVSNPESQLLTILQAAQLKSNGGQVELKREDIKSGLEAVFGQDRYQPFSWLQTGMTRCTAVARIEDVMQRRVGSGFLLDPSDFFGGPCKDPLLITNFHVISPAGKPFPNSLQPDNAVAVFEALNARYKVKNILWSSEVAKLDATLVTLEKMDPAPSPCPLKPAAQPFDPQAKQRVYVIGYPLGGPLSISLQDSDWLDRDDRVLHYRTPTEPGSSGSPVFDQNYWTVLGLHHKGLDTMARLHGQSGTYQANEAISLAAIKTAIAESGVKPAS